MTAKKRNHDTFLDAYKDLNTKRECECGHCGGDPLTDGNPHDLRVEEGERDERNKAEDDKYNAAIAALREAQDSIKLLEAKLDEIMAAPKVYGRVVEYHNSVDLEAFEPGCTVWVTDKEHPHYGRLAKVTSKVDVEDGSITLEFGDGNKDCLLVGIRDDKGQVKLLGKDDGTFAVVVVGEETYEVGALPGYTFNPGDKVKVNLASKQIIDGSDTAESGVLASVINTMESEPYIEVDVEGSRRLVHRGLEPKNDLEEGDKVILDNHKMIVIGHCDRDRRFTLAEQCNVTWDDIGGLEGAKEDIKEAVELPFRYPETFAHYSKSPPKGILLYGPPGCGKTLFGRATTRALAEIYGAQAMDTGFIYVKGPEILNMYVGNSEASIRELFQRGRKHYARHGFPAVLFIDEADAVLSERGTSRTSDMDKTIVPMFLSEMDGLVESHVLVMLATNRQTRLDPAVVREGRIDRHIKIPRPDAIAAESILRIHLRKIPVIGMSIDDLIHRAVADIYAKRRKIYKISDRTSKEELFFNFSDCITGAMLKGIVDEATSMALRRDIEHGSKTGIRPDDIKNAIETVYQRHLGLNHGFDLEDFYENHHLSEEACTQARVRIVDAKQNVEHEAA
jgi:proteasome-associated ATPase